MEFRWDEIENRDINFSHDVSYDTSCPRCEDNINDSGVEIINPPNGWVKKFNNINDFVNQLARCNSCGYKGKIENWFATSLRSWILKIVPEWAGQQNDQDVREKVGCTSGTRDLDKYLKQQRDDLLAHFFC